ncbi:MAG: oligosaccharyltransferase complex subunit epsilon [Bathelium mastoideum]|nr:MAG: oligosaccharyltransferase complex subunit epsilon [Bathelium mastoideum]
MAPKNRTTPAAASPAAAAPQHATSSAASQPTKPSSVPSSSSTTSSSGTKSTRSAQNAQEILLGVWENYLEQTAMRVKLIDIFMGFLVIVGVFQFVYCILAGNYPFNAFLAGFSATVGQFVLTASLRIQTNPENQSEFKTISPERAFADYVFGSILLHFFCVNFIN